MKHIATTCFLLTCTSFTGLGHAQGTSTYSYQQDGYAIEVPLTWREKQLNSPAGGVIRVFADDIDRRSAGYCQVEVQSLDRSRTPKLAAMSDKQRQEFLGKRFELDDWLQIYPNLASAQNFQIINSYPSEVGAHIPAAAIEFRFSIPNGYSYHVRAHVVPSKNKIYSLWCNSIGHNAADADNNFRRYLNEFTGVSARFKLIQR